MDYAVNSVLSSLNGLPSLLIMYDIMCQYFVNFRKRFAQSPMLDLPPGLSILRGIGQFHVHGHVTECFPRFSVNFIPGAGQQDGEIIETLWPQLNAISDSTRGMSTAHRQETFDDHMNDSNWKKLTHIGGVLPLPQTLVANVLRDLPPFGKAPTLIRRWKNVCREWRPANKAFNDISATITKATAAEWQRLADEADARRDQDVAAMDIYDMQKTSRKSRLM